MLIRAMRASSHRRSLAPPHWEAKQASVSPAHRPPRLGSAAFQVARPDHHRTPQRCSPRVQRAVLSLSIATGVVDIHSFGICRRHSFTRSLPPHVQRHLTPYHCLIPPTASPRPPLKRLHSPPSRTAYTLFQSWLRHSSALGLAPTTIPRLQQHIS